MEKIMTDQEKSQRLVKALNRLESEKYDAFMIKFNREVARLNETRRARLFDLITQDAR